MNDYHFSFGNSTDGPVGYCARVLAETPEQAVTKLQERLEKLGYNLDAVTGTDMELQWGEYIQVYFNAGAISIADIDYWNDENGNEHDPIVEFVKDIPLIIIEGGLIQDVVSLANPEGNNIENVKFDLDCWESGECPVCQEDIAEETNDDGDSFCPKCGATEGMSYSRLVECYLNCEGEQNV